MFTLKIENTKGEILQLTQNESSYQVIGIAGLNPPKANVYTNPVAGMDGNKFKSSKLEMRNIVLTFKINGDVEQNRLNIYRYIGTKKWCKISYKNGNRDVFIEGYCETIECGLFDIKQEMQISIICPDPYLKSLKTIYTDISKMFGAFQFPFAIDEEGVEISIYDPDRVTSIINDGELETGILITATALADNVQGLTLYNADSGEYMYLNATINKGEVIKINTNKGQKSIVKISNGEETNLINSLSGDSTWLQLDTGYNHFTFATDTSDKWVKVEIEYNHQYEGV